MKWILLAVNFGRLFMNAAFLADNMEKGNSGLSVVNVGACLVSTFGLYWVYRIFKIEEKYR